MGVIKLLVLEVTAQLSVPADPRSENRLVVLVIVLVLIITVGVKKQGNSTNINQGNRSRHNNMQYNLTKQQSSSIEQKKVDLYSTLQYYVILDKKIYGPLSLEQLKTYPLLEDTLITTNTLNGSWFEAKYFECLDELFHPNLPFRIDADGVIIRGGSKITSMALNV